MSRQSLILTLSLTLLTLTAVQARAACPGNWGEQIASYRGIEAYSNGTNVGCSDGVSPYGHKYQCVEYVKRFYGEEVDDVISQYWGPAADAYDLSDPGLNKYPNGGTTAPKEGDVLCFGPAPGQSNAGHVGIIAEVGSNYVKLIDQNRTISSTDNPKQLTMTVTGGTYTISSFSGSYAVEGWLRDPDYSPANYSCALVDQYINDIKAADVTVVAGEVLNLKVVYRNTGSEYWLKGEDVGVPHSVELWSCDPSGNSTASWFDPINWVGCPSVCSDIRVTDAVESPVDHEQTATFTFQAKVPDGAVNQDIRVWFRLFVQTTPIDGWPGQNFYIHVRNQPGACGGREITSCWAPPHTPCIGPE